MTETVNGTFLERHFGDLAARVEEQLVAAGLEAHGRSSDAKEGSRLKTNHPYGGCYWLALPEEVVQRLMPLLTGSLLFPPEGAQYELIVWNGIAILPVKVIDDGTRNGRMRARISQLRTRLTNVNMPDEPEQTLFDDLPGFRLDDRQADAQASVDAARKALGDIAQTVIVAAYSCNFKRGLQAVEVGIARLDEDGFIHFTDSQRLSITKAAASAPKPTLAAGESFDSAPAPKPALGLVTVDTVATGEDEPNKPVGYEEAE